jgi:Novel STAND NTPase 1
MVYKSGGDPHTARPCLMDLEKLRQLIERWQTLLASIGLLIGGLIAVRTQILSLKPQDWSWPEIIAIVLAVAAVGAVALRSRRAHLSRLVDPEALKLDPQSPEQLIGRREDLGKPLNALANPLVFLVGESGCGKSALLRAGVASGPAFAERFLPIDCVL